MGILSWILVGLVAGALLLGIGSALAGGFLGSLLGIGGVSGFGFTTIAAVMLGSLLLLWIYRMAAGRQHRPTHT